MTRWLRMQRLRYHLWVLWVQGHVSYNRRTGDWTLTDRGRRTLR